MLASSVDWKSKRETLRAKRDLLFKRYLKNPHDSRRALEIKNLDDEIAECTEHMDLNKAKAQISRLSHGSKGLLNGNHSRGAPL
jgi:hypothetical protein